jgi:ABC-2 type transport system permease protein
MSATAAATRAHLWEFARHRTTTVMLLALPPTVILVYGAAMGSFPGLPFLGRDPATAGRVIGAAFATAFLAGLVGLFQAIGARGSDDRLEIAGFPRLALLVSRVTTTVVIATVAAGVSLAVVAMGTEVAAPGRALLALLSGGLIYGLVGALVGQVLPRDLEGSLVLVFLADVDTALSSGFFESGTGLTAWFPLAHPIAAFEAAVYEGTLATGNLLAAGGYAVLVAILLASVQLLGGDGP